MPNVIQVFWPSSTHSSPSRRARVRSDARSDPASGSLKPCPQNSRPAVIRGRNRRFCSSVPNISRVGPNSSNPCTPARYGACARASSSFRTTSWYVGAPAPAVLAGPGQAEPAGRRELLVPPDADVPRLGVVRAAQAAVLGELADEVLVEPGAHLAAEGVLVVGDRPDRHVVASPSPRATASSSRCRDGLPNSSSPALARLRCRWAGCSQVIAMAPCTCTHTAAAAV